MSGPREAIRDNEDALSKGTLTSVVSSRQRPLNTSDWLLWTDACSRSETGC